MDWLLGSLMEAPVDQGRRPKQIMYSRKHIALAKSQGRNSKQTCHWVALAEELSAQYIGPQEAPAVTRLR
jgi:hypothetical protein